MTGDDAAVIAAISGLIVAVIGAVRGLTSDAFKRRVDQRASALTEYRQSLEELRRDRAEDREAFQAEIAALRAQHGAELAEVRRVHGEEIERLNRHHRRELDNTAEYLRQMDERFNADRARMQDEIETLKAQVTALTLQLRDR